MEIGGFLKILFEYYKWLFFCFSTYFNSFFKNNPNMNILFLFVLSPHIRYINIHYVYNNVHYNAALV